ncbi:unnamed protein product [Rotaria socialis]|uniref:Uncharacterized protein n=2 Tax=Rotaria socialis TaxID=392032 RepID=A0A818BAM8_9BILA|nr:unnamed protein product [Rotaria socialis]CAF3417475.1 unnamed protein product [Rotaria socialis]CAF4197464.1 unnamed protein product [Rotaria socialis]CAF4796016.1 unnamed protein product [Rotaria socialis]
MSNTFNNSAMIVNPILSTFPADQINIQPYWIVVLGLLVSQFFQRIWHQFKHHTWFTTLEIAGLILIFQQRLSNQNTKEKWASAVTVQPNNSGGTNGGLQSDRDRLQKLRSMLVVDFFDAISCLMTFGHAVWYCVIQSTCSNSSSSIATPWNCYNALGYRLFNYIFVSYFSTLLDCAYKGYVLGFSEIIKTDAKRGSFSWIMHYATLIVIALSLIFTTCILLPFVLTNLLPMLVIYIWMCIVYIGFCIYITVSGFKVYKNIKELPAKISKQDDAANKDSGQLEFCSFMFTSKEIPHVGLAMLLALVISTFPILLSILFNFSQFFYYGESYLKSINDDYISRDTSNYFNLLKSSTQQILHMVLNFL